MHPQSREVVKLLRISLSVSFLALQNRNASRWECQLKFVVGRANRKALLGTRPQHRKGTTTCFPNFAPGNEKLRFRRWIEPSKILATITGKCCSSDKSIQARCIMWFQYVERSFVSNFCTLLRGIKDLKYKMICFSEWKFTDLSDF